MLYSNCALNLWGLVEVIYSPREKLQLLRKHYKISQIELVGDKVSRSHLAMIETGKTKLSKRVAQVLVENFNEILEKRGVGDIITLDYVIEDTKDQITKKRAYYIEVLNKGILNDDLIYEIENFIKVSDISSKVVLYSKIGDFYFAADQLKRAFSYYARTFDEALIINDTKILENIVLKLSSINYRNKDYVNNLALEKAVKERLANFSFGKREYIYNNFIISFTSLQEYDRAISYLDKLLKETEDKEKLFILELKKAKFLEKKDKYISAISIYRGMLLKYQEEDKKLLINIKLMNAYKLKGEHSKVEIYYKKNMATLKKENISCQAVIENGQCLYFEMGLTSIYLEKNDKAFKFFKKAIETNVVCDEENLEKLFTNLLKLATKNDFEFIKSIETLYLDNVLEKRMFKIGYLFMNYYKENHFSIDADKFLNRLMSVI